MSAILALDSTLAEVLSTLAKPEYYVRGMLENMYACKREHGNATVQIGITGGGVAPNYRIEFELEESLLGDPKFKRGIVGVFDGRNHKLIKWIDDIAQEEEAIHVKDEHWSNHAMSLEDVAVFLGQIRQAKKR
ncbi:MAG: hypothetical protein WA624_21015 [Methylocella sp.]